MTDNEKLRTQSATEGLSAETVRAWKAKAERRFMTSSLGEYCPAEFLTLAEAYLALLSERRKMVEALTEIRDLEPAAYEMPADWSEQVEACDECFRYRDHPVQRGICDKHRRPLWDRGAHSDREEKRVGWRAKGIARAALTGSREQAPPPLAQPKNPPRPARDRDFA